MLGEPGQRGGERVDEAGAEPAGRPRLEVAEVELEADDREVRVQRRSDVDGTVQDAHPAPRATYPSAGSSDPAEATRVCRLNVAPATSTCSRKPSMQTGWPSVTLSIDE